MKKLVLVLALVLALAAARTWSFLGLHPPADALQAAARSLGHEEARTLRAWWRCGPVRGRAGARFALASGDELELELAQATPFTSWRIVSYARSTASDPASGGRAR